MQIPPYNPTHINTYGLGYSRFARRYSGNRENLLLERNGALPMDDNASVQKESSDLLLSLPPGTEMFHFPGLALSYKSDWSTPAGSPHSEISGSKVDWHLAETYRRHSASFIARSSLGIHHTPLHSHRECCTPLCNFMSSHRQRYDD